MKHRFTLLLVLLLSVISVKGQDYLDDIMFQSFGWDEYSQSRHTSEGGFYEYYNSRAGNLKAMGFDMIWLPPPSASTGGVGYFPTEWFNFSQTSWGSEAQLKKMLANMNARGLYPIADVVVNHRSGTTGWTDFTNPTWGCETICSNDDAASASYVGCRPSGAPDTGEGFPGSRDLDHTNLTVQNGVKDFLSRLKALGFKGWRWDVAKGFAPVYFGNYIQASQPYYSVGENWDGNATNLKNWIDGTYAGGINSSTTVSGAFDFSTYYALSGALKTNNFTNLKNSFTGAMNGLAGQIGYAEKAVTFVDNHDTFVKTEAILGNNIPKAYAYILTHPGIPCVFAPHYYGGTYTKDNVTRTYSTGYASEINKLMAIRKTTGINAYSHITIDKAESGLYTAYIKKNASDTEPVVAVKIGPNAWTPSLGTGWIQSASGTDYAVWTKTAINVAPIITITPSSSKNVSGTNVTVTISASDDSGKAPTIRYTLDGSEPTDSSPLYSSSFTVNSNTTVKAVAFDNLGLSSGVVERAYTFETPRNIVVRFKPPTTTPNWPLPKIHYWNYSPSNAFPAANWNTPIDMTADVDNPGWFKYTFPNIIQVNFLFRDGNSTGTLGVTKTGDIVNVTQDSWYEWDPTNSLFVKQVSLSTDDLAVNAKKVTLEILQNPALNGVIRVRYSNAKGGNLYLYDLSGKMLKTQKVSANSGDDTISVSNLQTGNYLLMLKSDQGMSVSKVIIK
ncbi:MAG: chitobiase/beta-hexosaminidase C-terminal domain-containing protein [Cloacibacterium caeni]